MGAGGLVGYACRATACGAAADGDGTFPPDSTPEGDPVVRRLTIGVVASDGRWRASAAWRATPAVGLGSPGAIEPGAGPLLPRRGLRATAPGRPRFSAPTPAAPDGVTGFDGVAARDRTGLTAVGTDAAGCDCSAAGGRRAKLICGSAPGSPCLSGTRS